MPESGAPPAASPTPRKDVGERFWDILGFSDDAAELPNPEWRRRLHRFCENWIFALIIAFGIRHFGAELFRIPSASMEPMLLGDPGLGKGDFVLVDKLTARFRPVQRWDVAVFQYPVPEVESGKGGRARPAISTNGDRLDDPLTRPLLGGNFVKRAVILPGDEFYILGGDVFLHENGAWHIARKPPALQEHLWQTIWRAGDQPSYRPWTAEGGSTVELTSDRIQLKLSGGPVRFTQPLRNLYLKDGSVAIRRLGSSDGYTVVHDVGMTRPAFAWAGGVDGSIWDLDRWDLKRLTSADMDDANRGTQINALMREWTGDVRFGGRVEALEGEVAFVFENRALGAAEALRSLELTLSPTGWKLTGADAEATGQASLVGKQIDVAHIDGQVVVRIDGLEVARRDVLWLNPNEARPSLRFQGTGTLVLSRAQIQRDLHYTAKGFLVLAPDAADPDAAAENIRSGKGDSEDHDNQFAGSVRLPRSVRSQLLGKSPDDLTRSEATRAYGTGPDNPAHAPQGGYLMLGDNSPLSLDGREWGFVPAENLRGSGWLVVFPPQRWKVIR